MFYELTTLSCPLPAVYVVAEGAKAWTHDEEAGGSLLGLWQTEIVARQVPMLRGFDTRQVLTVERDRALSSDRPFNAGSGVTALDIASYAPFPFLPPVHPGARGPVYEFRTYWLKPGGLLPTTAGWRQAIELAREYTEHLVINMFALDGSPRITHIWGFRELGQRAELRTKHYAEGTWPPPGDPEQIADAASTTALPVAASPLTSSQSGCDGVCLAEVSGGRQAGDRFGTGMRWNNWPGPSQPVGAKSPFREDPEGTRHHPF